MRVLCQTIDDFIENLRDADHVFGNVVRTTIDYPNESLSEEVLKLEVVFGASALIILNPETEEGFLLSVMLEAGIDYKDGGGSSEGTEKATEWKQQVVKVAEELGYKTKPGWIEF